MPCYTIRTTSVEWGQNTDTKLMAEAAQKLGFRVLAQTEDTLQTDGWTYTKQSGRLTGTRVPGDLNALKTIYADDYILVRQDGQTLSKSQILDDLKMSGMTFPRFEANYLRIKTLGPVGVLSTEVRSTFLRNGQEGEVHAQQVVVFFKTGQEVTISHLQLTNLAG